MAATRMTTLFVWPLSGGEPERLLGRESPAFTLLALCKGRVLSGSSDGSIRLWNLDQKSSTIIGQFDQPIRSLTGTANGHVLLSVAGKDFGPSELTTWDLQTQKPTHVFTYDESIDSAALSGDGRHLLAAANKTLLHFDCPLRAAPTVVGVHDWKISRVIVGDDGLSAVSADTGGTLCVWNLREPDPPRILRGHRLLARDLALRNDTLASVGDDRTLRLWTFPPPRPKSAAFVHGSAITSLSTFEYDGHSLAISASEDATLAIWDLEGPRKISRPMRHDTRVSGVVPLPDMGRCVSAAWDGRLSVWELPSGKHIESMRVPDANIVALAVDRRGEVAIIAPFKGALRFWDVIRNREATYEAVEVHRATCLALADDSNYMIAAGEGWKTVVFADACHQSGDSSCGERRRVHIYEPPAVERFRINAVCRFPESSQFILATATGQLIQFDSRANQVTKLWQDNSCGFADVAVSPCGRWVASVGGLPMANSDDTLRIWDSRTGKVRSRFIGNCPIRRCTFYAGNHLVIGDAWGRLHLFSFEPK